MQPCTEAYWYHGRSIFFLQQTFFTQNKRYFSPQRINFICKEYFSPQRIFLPTKNICIDKEGPTVPNWTRGATTTGTNHYEKAKSRLFTLRKKIFVAKNFLFLCGKNIFDGKKCSLLRKIFFAKKISFVRKNSLWRKIFPVEKNILCGRNILCGEKIFPEKLVIVEKIFFAKKNYSFWRKKFSLRKKYSLWRKLSFVEKNIFADGNIMLSWHH